MSVYVGIHNNGALCYLISVIQQLYFMHDFKEVIMSTNSENEKAQALIDKLRILFTAMDHRQEIDDIQCEPIFNHLYPNLAGGIYTQKDASEFLSDLIRTVGLDMHLKGTLTGQLVNTLKAEDDGSGTQRHLKRPEKFLFTSLTVNCPDGINNLEASLQDFTKTETIQFRWPQQPSAVPAAPLSPVSTQKQTMFQTLPKHLTFHLKRFKFNVATMKKEKLHHRFEFPNELDMSPFISQMSVPSQPNTGTETATDNTDKTLGAGNSPTSHRYQLSGVVVHKGKSAYRGHYYSFVRERKNDSNIKESSTIAGACTVTTPSETDQITTSANINVDVTNATEGMQDLALVESAHSTTASSADRWFLFDDFDVMPFNPAYSDVECFGGPRVKKYSSYGRSRSRSDNSCSDRSRRSNSSHGSKNSSAGESEASQHSSASNSNANDNEGSTREDHQPDQANTDVVESIAECTESITDNVDVLTIHPDEPENGDADSTASSCASENCSIDDDESGSSENSENSESEDDDSSSYISDSSDDTESSDDSDQSEEEEGSYVPTRGKFKSAFLLFYDRIEA